MPLGQTGLTVSRLGLGTMVWGEAVGRAIWSPAQLVYGPSDGPEEEERALATSLAAGVNFVDTAEMYSLGASEKRVGEVVRGKDVFLATKFPPELSSSLKDFESSLDASLERLGRDTIDLFQHHVPSRRTPIPELMNLMADAVEAGKIRAVGVSNYTAGQMRTAHEALAKRGIALASNQVEYSLLHRQPEVDGVLEACRELGVTLIAYSPLAAGALTGKYKVGSPRPTGLRRFIDVRFTRHGLHSIEPLLELVHEIGERHSATPSQIALRWLLEMDGVLAIPGVKNAEQAASDAAALDFSLTAEEIEQLDLATERWLEVP